MTKGEDQKQRQQPRMGLQYDSADGSTHTLTVTADPRLAVPVALTLAGIRARMTALSDLTERLRAGEVSTDADPATVEAIAEIMKVYSESLEGALLATLVKLFPTGDSDFFDKIFRI